MSQENGLSMAPLKMVPCSTSTWSFQIARYDTKYTNKILIHFLNSSHLTASKHKQIDYNIITNKQTNYQGNSIYAEIPANLAEEKGALIETNQIYDISRFRVTAAKTAYKPIDGDKMIQFTIYTIIKPASNPPPTFPLYIYQLTPFDEIESQIQHKTKFLGNIKNSFSNSIELHFLTALLPIF